MFSIPTVEDKIELSEIETRTMQAKLAKEQAQRLGINLESYDQKIRESEIRHIVQTAPMRAIRCEVEDFVDSGEFIGWQLAVNHELVTCTHIDFNGTERFVDKFEVSKIEDYEEAIPADVLMVCNKWKCLFKGEQSFEIYSPKWSTDPVVVMRFNGGRLSYIIADWNEFYEYPQDDATMEEIKKQGLI